jgi:hypothetical protein
MLANILRQSSFWVAVVTAIGGVLVQFIPTWKPVWEQIVLPAIVYILARLMGQAAKAVIPPSA